MIHCLFLMSRQGKTRLTKWFSQSFTSKQKTRYLKEINSIVLTRSSRLCNFLEWNDYKIVYKRYASLYFITIVDKEENELGILEIIHHYVECLDKYFGNVCELDLIFNFHKAYFILDELMISGHVMEPSKKVILKAIQSQEVFEEENQDTNKK
ncbi:hypothetical protein IMG5_071970 [Ichthyophthirius multifiliis]|uniref:AP complex subunit sigma n=1 Tax=Ichthyophthirius multifiliis TaxID=5932 RepID=G0QPW6_ICHMU|nr:hypothetical protein IMG5_071970 [Ichthyophthirius multifiliis]EGR32744.1 hypothetical protein IMG5_071970 [Ichthyophthirius multifiliis]|eukprot:XP_004036730.1 hypothetical protein IMG5_071970 [Ichthyophthirius multifiliis]